MILNIDHSDEISRCIIYDRAFEHDLHVDAFLWRFESKSDDGVYHESAVLRRLAPDGSDVHKIGCSIAATQNFRKSEPQPGPSRRYYCGFRTAAVASLPCSGEGYLVVLTHLPEDGEHAHVDVALHLTVEGRSARATCRTNAGLALAEQFGPPASHCCECDATDEYHPLALWGDECLFSGLRDRWSDLKLCDNQVIADDAGYENQLKLIQ
ncbi:MAG: hypothetical protein ACT6RX_04285 [Sphingopyxis solisilvae]